MNSPVVRAARLILPGLATLLASSAGAQGVPEPHISVGHQVFAGGELESYLRYLQTLDTVAAYPLSIRGLAPAEVARLSHSGSAHPWAARFDFGEEEDGRPHLSWVRPRVGLTYNSAFPFGGNDGPVWAGRGLTSSAQFGASVRFGPLSMILAPEAFWTENAAFELRPNGYADFLRFGAPFHPFLIDLPQRFGEESYTRVDPGQSTLRLEVGLVAAGVSTANQFWGPASEHPIVLGNNAPGFPHGFFGTARPVNVWIGRVHARAVVGRLDQSEYSPVVGRDGRRLMSGLVGTYLPRGIDGLELGASRFFHSFWPSQGLAFRDLGRPFEGLFKSDLEDELREDPDRNAENQLAAVFFRWAPPGTGFEVYGELGREDHPWNLRQLVLQPDDVSGYMLGFRKAWRRSEREMAALRGEVINTRISHLALADPERGQPPMYLHSSQRQGHTQRGQMLASPLGFTGGGALLAADWYHPGGRWSLSWERGLQYLVRGDRPMNRAAGREPDVTHAVGLEGVVFLGRLEATLGLTGVYNLNRDFASDAFNLNGRFLLRAAL